MEQRQKVLAEIIYQFKRKNKIVTGPELVSVMRKKYPGYNRTNLYTDRTALNAKNTYIRDFLPNYSAYQQDISELLDWIVAESQRNYFKTWVSKKTTTKETKDGEFETVTESSEVAAPKKMFLEVMLKAIDLKQKHAQGQNVLIGAVVIQRELNNQKAQIKQLEAKAETVKETPHEKDR